MNEIHAGQDQSRTGSIVGTLITRVIVPLHVLFGAVMKWLDGSPDALPQWVQARVMHGEITLIDDPMLLPADIATGTLMILLKAFICIELIAAGVMLFVPRLARPVAILMLLAFLAVLVAEIMTLGNSPGRTMMSAAFEEACGCYGSALTVSLGVMLLIDAVLLILVLVFPPTVRRDAPFVSKWSLAGLILWIPVMLTLGLNPYIDDTPKLPWHERNVFYWVGHPLSESPIAKHLPQLPRDFGPVPQTWVLYRKSCSACHHLFETEYSGDLGDRVVVAVHLPHAPDAIVLTEEEEIDCPDCQYLELPVGPDYPYATPTVIEVDADGIITKVRDPKLVEASTDERDSGAEIIPAPGRRRHTGPTLDQ
ncbi:MAG: hypothetical protein ACR2GY_09770 [Phycisphaerales bacterium]